ncbi:MAG: hypothetical protein Q8T11_18875 [Elusimicrobiota bacterium]|nr:hypothetical protein [Elusimicrobiota bacterium]
MPLLFLLSSLIASPVFAKAMPVELGREFRLKKGEVAAIEGDRATLRIVRFINSPCPKGARCVWSGQAVITELTVDGKVVPEDAKTRPYDVLVKDSDFKTFAVLVVDEPEAACRRPKAGHLGECLRGLARRRSDPALCSKIDDERTRGFCLEDLAEELKRDDLCEGVANPTQHCLYLKAKKAGDRKLCEGIVTFGARERCLKEL